MELALRGARALWWPVLAAVRGAGVSARLVCLVRDLTLPLSLRPIEAAVLAALAHFVPRGRTTTVSMKDLSQRTRFTRRGIQKAIRDLERKGLLRCQFRISQTNEYTVLPKGRHAGPST